MPRNYSNILIGTLFLSLALIASADYKLVWQDEFNGNNLDLSKWQYEVDCNGGGNNELQCYTNHASNVQVRDGSLYVTARKENYNGKQFTSGRINTKASAAWKYGKFEIRAKLPRGDYLWPALWLLPRDSVYGGWAASGEIDIMEARGQLTSKIESTLHHGSGWPNNVYTGSGPIDMKTDLAADFHVYGLVWEKDQMQFSLDGKVYHTANLNRNWYGGRGNNPYNANRQPFDQPFFFIINNAIGGGFFGGQANELINNPGVVSSWSSPSLVVDYVRVYQDDGTPNVNPAPVPVPTSNKAPVPVPSNNAPATPKPADTPKPQPPAQPPVNNKACPNGCGAASCCDDGRIGGVCYDQKTHSCSADLFNQAKTYLCAKGASSCKGACFDTRSYKCDNGRISPL